jgi:ABC-type transport system involved in multi-copper enzyme maturation permease subunit
MLSKKPAVLWTIAKKEIVANLLSYKFFIVILLTIILISTSFFILCRDYKGRLADYELIRAKPGEPIAVIAPNPLSVFAKGLEDPMTRSFEVSVTGITARSGQKSGNLLFSFFPVPDFLYVVRVVLSLVALLFGFDQISREKETGTLKLMLANQISRARILTGKWISNFLCLSVPFLLVTLLGLAILSLSPDIHFASRDLSRLTIIILVSLLYIALFLSLGILISTLTKRATSSIVILLFIWTTFVFIVPNLGTLVAGQIVNPPSVKTLNEKRQQAWTREVLLGIKEKNRSASTWQGHYKAIYSEMDKVEEDYINKSNQLVRWAKNINRISPVASFVYAVTEIAGTGIGEESQLKRAVISYKNSIFTDLASSLLDNKKKDYRAFIYRPRSLSEIFAQGAFFDTAWLVVLNIILFTISFFAFVKYDVR